MPTLRFIGLSCSIIGALCCTSEPGANTTQTQERPALPGAAASNEGVLTDSGPPAGNSGTRESTTKPVPAKQPSEGRPGPVTDSPVDGGNTSTGVSIFPNGTSKPRIMIVGDSISAGPGCYKKYLLADLSANGYSNFEFVGEYTDDCGGGVLHSARSCTTAFDYTQPTFTLRAECGGGSFPGLAPLMAAHEPDLLILQLGVNDVWNGESTNNILASYSALLEQARAANPSIVVAVAQIQKISPAGADGEAVFGRAQALVEAVPEWARSHTEPTSAVLVADLWTNSDPAETLDGVHPDDAGAQRMGHNWFVALSSILPAK